MAAIHLPGSPNSRSLLASWAKLTQKSVFSCFQGYPFQGWFKGEPNGNQPFLRAPKKRHTTDTPIQSPELLPATGSKELQACVRSRLSWLVLARMSHVQAPKPPSNLNARGSDICRRPPYSIHSANKLWSEMFKYVTWLTLHVTVENCLSLCRSPNLTYTSQLSCGYLCSCNPNSACCMCFALPTKALHATLLIPRDERRQDLSAPLASPVPTFIC